MMFRRNTGLTWIKSSLSFANGNCVEMATLPNGGVAMRDSKNPRTILRFTRPEWDAFIAGVNNGEFDLDA